MNKWWKMGLLGAAALGATALTGGLAAPELTGLLGGEGAAGAGAAGAAGAGAAGAAGAGEAAAAGLGTAGAADAAGTVAATTAADTAAAAAPTAFVTPPVTSGLLGSASAAPAGANMGMLGLDATAADPTGVAAVAQSPWATAGHYAMNAGKAASAYGTVTGAMGGGQQGMAPPAPHPIYQGEQAPIAQQMGGQTPQNAFLQLLMQQRQRGMLG